MSPLLIFLVISKACGAIFYDSYTGHPLTESDVQQYHKAQNLDWCVREIEPCDPEEGRRIDGSCNNLSHPSRGTVHSPFYRLLASSFGKNFEPRLSKSGNELPLPRYLRTRLISTGRVLDQNLSLLAVYFFGFTVVDIVSLHDTINYIKLRPYCCAEQGKSDDMCVQNKVPNDDPVHRFSNHRCLNMTIPETFQTIGCAAKDTVPNSAISSTPLLDLSSIYGYDSKSISLKGRQFEGGLLKTEILNGRVWPPSSKGPTNACPQNDEATETRCHDTPDDSINVLIGTNMLSICMWRHHNMIATELAKVNPCWDDEQLFYAARDINIATMLQIFYYEVMPALLGYDNLVNDGVLMPTGDFRDNYNDTIISQLTLEYSYIIRWAHKLHPGAIKMYDKDGVYMKQFPAMNLTLRTGYLALDDNLDLITQGSFRQGSAKMGYVDPDIVDIGLGSLQQATDIMTNDISKGRYFGMAPYVKYIQFCFGKTISSFEDLIDFVNPEMIEILKEVYEDVEDIDLITGLWSERNIHSGRVPSTFYCLVKDQLWRNMISDRHWYERPNRPHAFNNEQLKEIRKASIARLLCDTGDTVTKIQPHACFKAGPGNEMVDCSNIDKIDYAAWKNYT